MDHIIWINFIRIVEFSIYASFIGVPSLVDFCNQFKSISLGKSQQKSQLLQKKFHWILFAFRFVEIERWYVYHEIAPN